MLEVREGEVGRTHVQTYSRQGPVVHVTPQGQPLYGPPIYFQQPVTVQVPMLIGTTHEGTTSNFPMPTAADGSPLNPSARAAAVAAWTAPSRACVWCRERAGDEAAEAVLEAQRRAALAAAAAREREAAAEAARRAEAERQELAAHSDRFEAHRARHGPEQPIHRQIRQLQNVLSRPSVTEPSWLLSFARGHEWLFNRAPAWLPSGLLLGGAFGGYALGQAWGAGAALLLLFAVPVLLVGGTVALERRVRENQLERSSSQAMARREAERQIAALEGKLGCGDRSCTRCGRAARP